MIAKWCHLNLMVIFITFVSGNKMENVIDMGKEKKFPVNNELVKELHEVINKFVGRISLAEAIGALELVKISVIDDAHSNDEGE